MSDPSDYPGPFDTLIEEELDRSLMQEEEEEKLIASFQQKEEFILEASLTPKFTPHFYEGYHHVTWYVGNAKQAAFYFMVAFGFSLFAYKGLETGSREVCSYVLKNGGTCFEFCSPLRDNLSSEGSMLTTALEINEFIEKHGEGVKDVAFSVSSLSEVVETAVKFGAEVIRPISHARAIDSNGGLAYIITATLQIIGDTYHTLIERSDNYEGFLPGYKTIAKHPGLNIYQDATFFELLPPVKLKMIDHCVQNQNWNELNKSCEMYKRTLGFERFWSVDDGQISTQFSALNSIVMASPGELIKMPINEPAKGICKSQIEEFLDFYSGPGVQHIAIRTDNIIDTVSAMKDRGVEFINVPIAYYDNLKTRMEKADFKMEEQFEEIQKLGILVDFDESGYLLQLFTKPLVTRPTIFVEIIQRRNHNGFGAGNFKALFETLENLQKERGNLTYSDTGLETGSDRFFD